MRVEIVAPGRAPGAAVPSADEIAAMVAVLEAMERDGDADRAAADREARAGNRWKHAARDYETDAAILTHARR